MNFLDKSIHSKVVIDFVFELTWAEVWAGQWLCNICGSIRTTVISLESLTLRTLSTLSSDKKLFIAFLAISWNSKVFQKKYFFRSNWWKVLVKIPKKIVRGEVYISSWESGHKVYLLIWVHCSRLIRVQAYHPITSHLS